MVKQIESKIVGVKVKKPGEEVPEKVVEVQAPADVDPLLVRVENRPEGTLEAVSEKISYNTSEGKKKVYVLVSFINVDGVIDGQPVTIERPIEFFFPVGQLSSEHQWITATMRNLSLAARGGYVSQALADLRKVTWDKGPVRCGKNEWGKPNFHDSEVAAIAWSIQQILYKRGFVDRDGNQVPAKVLARKFKERYQVGKPSVGSEDLDTALIPEGDSEIAVVAAEPFGEDSVGAARVKKGVGDCPKCGSTMQLLDGCPTCVEGCGWSKCG
jgi:ribonucleoside-diphosphate reductase alpha chain